jgi:hypothetical protein
LEKEGKDALKKAKAYARGAYDYIEGGVQIALGALICFYGSTMIDWTIKIIVFLGLTAGLFMGFQSVNDASDVYPAFKEKDQTAQLVIGGVCLVLSGGLTYLLSLKFVTKENTTKVVGFACCWYLHANLGQDPLNDSRRLRWRLLCCWK